MAEFRITVVVDPSGAVRGSRRVERELNRVGGHADPTRQLNSRAFQFAAVGEGIRRLVALADVFTNIQNRLRTVTDGTAQLAVVTQELFEISNRTRSSFEATAELYARVGLAAKDLGVSQNQLLRFTESVNQAIILSGASATEAQAGLIQLSQGLASGALRGDELRSVLEQLPVVADVIAKSMGITRGELRELGAQGSITADIVLNAFEEAREELAERFGKTVPTISQSFTVLRNNLLQLVGAFDTNAGVSGFLSRTILALAENVETLARALGAVSIVLAVNFARQGVGAAINAVRALTLAIAANPLGALVTGLTIAIATLISFGDQMQLTAGSSATVLDFLAVTFDRLSGVVVTVVDGILQALGVFQGSLDDVDFLTFVRAAAVQLDRLIGVFRGAFLAIKAIFEDLPRVIGDAVVTGLNFILRQTGEFVQAIIDNLNRIPGVTIASIEGAIPQLSNPFAGAGTAVGEEFVRGYEEAVRVGLASGFVEGVAADAEQRATERLRRQAEQQRALDEARGGLGDAPAGAAPVTADSQLFNDILRKLREEGNLLQLNNRERQIQEGLLRVESQLKRELLPGERQIVEALLRQNQELEERRAVLDSIRGPEEELREHQRVLNDLFNAGAISAAEFSEEMRILNTDLTALDNTLRGGIANGFARIAEEANNLGRDVSNFIVGAFDQASDAIVNFARTGELNLRAFFSDLFAQLAKLALNQTFASLAGGLFGGGGFLGNIFGGLFGGLPGFASGGSFEVGQGSSLATVPGRDNRVVAFRARDGERVTVTPPGAGTGGNGGGGRGRDTVINFNISTPDADSFRRSQSQIMARTNAALRRADQRDN